MMSPPFLLRSLVTRLCSTTEFLHLIVVHSGQGYIKEA